MKLISFLALAAAAISAPTVPKPTDGSTYFLRIDA
jgi:hypothetical protein